VACRSWNDLLAQVRMSRFSASSVSTSGDWSGTIGGRMRSIGERRTSPSSAH
jgi:hypothetical protein